jgi:hypothetical protein
LTARAVAAIDRLGATTVRSFLEVPLRRVYRLPGSKIRQEVVEAFNALRVRFPELVPKRALSKETDTSTEAASSSIDVLLDALNFIRKTHLREASAQSLLASLISGFAWPCGWPAAARWPPAHTRLDGARAPGSVGASLRNHCAPGAVAAFFYPMAAS